MRRKEGTQQACAPTKRSPYRIHGACLLGDDRHVRLVRLERLEPRFQDVKGVVGDVQTALQVGVALAAACPGAGLRALQGVEAGRDPSEGGPLPGFVPGAKSPESI